MTKAIRELYKQINENENENNLAATLQRDRDNKRSANVDIVNQSLDDKNVNDANRYQPTSANTSVTASRSAVTSASRSVQTDPESVNATLTPMQRAQANYDGPSGPTSRPKTGVVVRGSESTGTRRDNTTGMQNTQTPLNVHAPAEKILNSDGKKIEVAPRDGQNEGEAEAKANLKGMQQTYKADKALINKANPISKVGTETSNLRVGSRGDDVRALQRSLGIKADGIFGPQTAAALKDFQKKQGLQVDSIAGDQTMSALRRQSAQNKLRNNNRMVASTLGEELLNAFNKVVSSKHPNIFQEAKGAATKTAKEKQLAALAEPKDKITRKDILVGRGVVKEDELGEQETIRGVFKDNGEEYVPDISAKTMRGAGVKINDKDIPIPAKKPVRTSEVPIPAKKPNGKMITSSYNKEEVELDEGNKPIIQGSKEHLAKLKGMLDNVKPGSPEHSQIRDAISSIFGDKHIPEKHKNVKPHWMREEVESLFSEAELAYFEGIGNIAGKPDDKYAPNGNNDISNATGSRSGTLSDETIKEAKRGRPKKEESLGANQLHMNAKRAADNMSNVKHTFENGQTIRMTKAMGVAFLNRHSAARTPEEKENIVKQAHKNPSAFKDVIEGKPVVVNTKNKISLAGKYR